jgi:hypothetical protein
MYFISYVRQLKLTAKDMIKLMNLALSFAVYFSQRTFSNNNFQSVKRQKYIFRKLFLNIIVKTHLV